MTPQKSSISGGPGMMALITGAAGGLGRAMAGECASRGYSLFLTDTREDALLRIRGGMECQYGVRVYTFACDLTSAQGVTGLLEYMDRSALYPDMLLNVAGIDFEGPFMQQNCESLLGIVRLNIEATMRITHSVLARRQPERPFYIVNVSSLASLYPMPLKATYAASKRFLLDFSIALGRELKAEGVRVLALCPGGLATTRGALIGIAAQGFWGSVTTNKLSVVAHRTISRVLAGRHIYIPGAVNRAFSALGKLIPAGIVAALLYRRWDAAQAQWGRLERKMGME